MNVFNLIVMPLTAFIDAIWADRVFSLMTKKKYPTAKARMFFGLYAFAMVIIALVCDTTVVRVSLVVACAAIYIFFFFEGLAYAKLFGILFYLLLLLSGEHFATGIMMFFFPQLTGEQIAQHASAKIIATLICYSYDALYLFILYRFSWKNAIPKAYGNVLAVLTAGFALNAHLVQFYLYRVIALPAIVNLVSALAVVAITVGILAIHRVLSKYETEKSAYMLLDSQIEQYHRQYEQMEQNLLQLRRSKHDFVHHLTYIQSLLAASEQSAVSEYITQIEKEMPTLHQEPLSGNLLVDTLLTDKKQLAHNRGIETDIVVSIPKELGIPKPDLCVLISNPMDNAIEACEKMPEGQRRHIRVRLFMRPPYLYIDIVNTIHKQPERIDGRFVSTKKARNTHGYGLINVRMLLNRYNGHYKVEYYDHTFIFTSMLQLPDEVIERWKRHDSDDHPEDY